MSLQKIFSLGKLKSIALVGAAVLFMSTFAQATPVTFTIGSVTLTGVSCSGQCVAYTTDLPMQVVSPLGPFSLNAGQSVTLDVIKFIMTGQRITHSFTVTGNLNFDLTTPNGTTAVVLLTAIRVNGGNNTVPDTVTMTFGNPVNAYFGFNNSGRLQIDMIDLSVTNPQPDHLTAQGTFTRVPEPSSLVLLGMGLLGAAFKVRRKH